MSELTYTLELHRNGGMIHKTTVAARKAGFVGNWYMGNPYQPSNRETLAATPYHYRKAFERAVLKWWQDSGMSGRYMPLKCDLTNHKGQPMGTIIAIPNWPK